MLRLPLWAVLVAIFAIAGASFAFANGGGADQGIVKGQTVPLHFICRDKEAVIQMGAASENDPREVEMLFQLYKRARQCGLLPGGREGLPGTVSEVLGSGVDFDQDVFYILEVYNPENGEGPFYTIVWPSTWGPEV